MDIFAQKKLFSLGIEIEFLDLDSVITFTIFKNNKFIDIELPICYLSQNKT